MRDEAVIENGAIRPLEPLPAEWRDGREVDIEDADRSPTDDLDEWDRELHLLGPALYEPGESEKAQELLKEADEQAKSLVRAEMGLI